VLEHGMIDLVVQRRELRDTLARILRVLIQGAARRAQRPQRPVTRGFRRAPTRRRLPGRPRSDAGWDLKSAFAPPCRSRLPERAYPSLLTPGPTVADCRHGPCRLGAAGKRAGLYVATW
jgi:hypothetical protein